jgi:hypothetical protein
MMTTTEESAGSAAPERVSGADVLQKLGVIRREKENSKD